MVEVQYVLEHGKRWRKWTLVAQWIDGTRFIIAERLTWRKALRKEKTFLSIMNGVG